MRYSGHIRKGFLVFSLLSSDNNLRTKKIKVIEVGGWGGGVADERLELGQEMGEWCIDGA